ncbi:MAG: hypothetical protein LIO58_01885 [Oscillospiraceae bacterium]|nr:hypothetical protein [Oscillospiraceae bacterium]
METKNRNTLIILTAVVIAIAVFAAFGRNLFVLNLDPITMPQVLGTDTQMIVDPDTELIWIEVTPDTVQDVIATLTRPESYYRTLKVEDFAQDGSSSETTMQTWSDDGWTKTQTTSANGVVRTSIVGDGTLWWWYAGSGSAASAPADEKSADVDGQRIPTYEDVLAMDKEDIRQSGYESWNDLPCVYVAVDGGIEHYERRYWISVESGLLVCAEIWDGEVLCYRMSSGQVERPVSAGTSFALPDGTALHTVEATDAIPAP